MLSLSLSLSRLTGISKDSFENEAREARCSHACDRVHREEANQRAASARQFARVN